MSETTPPEAPFVKPAHTDLVVITGLSGSGKTLAMRALEDLTYYCVDNLPIELVPVFYDLAKTSGRDTSKVGLVVDIRGGKRIAELPERLREVREQGTSVCLLYLDADDETLLTRFTESRRPHPLSASEPLPESIAREREILAPIREHADLVLDTSHITPHELRDFMFENFREGIHERIPRVVVQSFGFKHGPPDNADLVFDVRFLPNPHFVEGLREKTGEDAEVRDYLEESELYREFRTRIIDLLDFLLPAYTEEGKSYLTLAFGCTGGRHRSVTIAIQVAEALGERGYRADLRHRDASRGTA